VRPSSAERIVETRDARDPLCDFYATSFASFLPLLARDLFSAWLITALFAVVIFNGRPDPLVFFSPPVLS